MNFNVKISLTFCCFLILICLIWSNLVSAGKMIPLNRQKSKLLISVWSTWIPERFIKSFEKKHNCKVICDYISSTEEFITKVDVHGKKFRTDVIFLSLNALKPLYDRRTVKPLDISRIPRLQHIKKPEKHLAVGSLNGDSYSIQITFSAACVVYNKDVMKRLELTESDLQSISILDNPKIKGKASFIDDGREILGYALKKAGLSVNPETIDGVIHVEHIMRKWRKNICVIGYRITDVLLGSLLFSLEDLHMVEEIDKLDNIGYTFFKDVGRVVFGNSVFISSNVENENLAYQFINEILLEENIDTICRTTNESSLFASDLYRSMVNKKDIVNYIPDEVMVESSNLWMKFKYNTF